MTKKPTEIERTRAELRQGWERYRDSHAPSTVIIHGLGDTLPEAEPSDRTVEIAKWLTRFYLHAQEAKELGCEPPRFPDPPKPKKRRGRPSGTGGRVDPELISACTDEMVDLLACGRLHQPNVLLRPSSLIAEGA